MHAAGAKKWKPSGLLKFLALLICFAFLARIIMELGPQQVWETALQAEPLGLILSALLLIAMFALWALKWQRIAAREFKLPFASSFRLIMVGNFINTLTPTAKLGGGFIRALGLKRIKGMRMSEAYGWVLADQIGNFWGKTLLFGITCALVAQLQDMAQWRTPLVGIALGCLALTALWFPIRPRIWNGVVKRGREGGFQRWIPKMLKNRGNPEEQAQAIARPAFSLGTPLQILGVDMGFSAVALALFCLSNGFVLNALGSTAPMTLICLAVMLSYLGGAVLGFTGGIGVTELILIKVYSMAGVAPETAAAGALLHRAMFYVFSFTVGGYAAWREGRAEKANRDQADKRLPG